MPRQAESITHLLAQLDSADPQFQPAAPLYIHFPSAVVRAPGTHLDKDTSAATPTFSVSASALSDLSLPNCDLSPCSSATSDSSTSTNPVAAQQVPKYLVVGLDLDAPFPSFPVMGPFVHGVQADLSLATDRLHPNDDFIDLELSPAASVDDNRSSPVVGYMGPAPPGPSSPHRYMFMLWEQPARLTRDTICEKLGIPATAEGEVGIVARARWDQEAFERKLGLGKVVAGNYFVC
ncbi:phosphatidylethanolamine-binding protein [Podospora appendiculata]|uniref:Phosphatidylethanolamine-binding protein n=1 Tax=Podospora appendiculata TaxID=314037 RepID=A0AAE0X8E3_9PEZI|nr:phosphatidylethanolamine-binding protein [Podospora appendiculata]